MEDHLLCSVEPILLSIWEAIWLLYQSARTRIYNVVWLRHGTITAHTLQEIPCQIANASAFDFWSTM